MARFTSHADVIIAALRRLARALAPWVMVGLFYALVFWGHLVPAPVVWVATAVVVVLMVREAVLAPARFRAGVLR